MQSEIQKQINKYVFKKCLTGMTAWKTVLGLSCWCMRKDLVECSKKTNHEGKLRQILSPGKN